ncbi:protein-tyrosine phosphatase [Kineosphaera limosa]|uniref:protein-tyrosine-phosphatase n=1 Tax=Kineosphaera limosa NBRC 100340 TaxID=1184609 RepID=K6XD13_9MICO|nr:low molecular weight protein-tyrosine-phosphatase [Kineosphaera limosa]NYE01547.1 protein-tyrosine phosphatase [Kineosphaera limosa]GAB96704.1 putative protein-tyrosine phosphatase [Kineosphaera limosa NBRC 100340]
MVTTNDKYRVCVVCSGNICRSPMAEVVLREAFTDAGLGDRVVVDSAGTGGWHLGGGADRRALNALAAAGFDGTAHRARQIEPDWFDDRDLILCADSGHLAAMQRMGRDSDADVRLLREFDPQASGDLDLADPYYGTPDDFEECLEQIRRAAPGIVEQVRADLG